MKTKCLICLSVLALVAISNGAYPSPVVQAVDPNLEVVSADMYAALCAKGLEYADSTWPQALDARQVSRGTIPSSVIDRASGWIRTIVVAKWLPEDVNDRLIGVRKELKVIPPELVDYLVMRYYVSGNIVQIQEGACGMSILVQRREGMPKDQTVEDFLAVAVKEILNYPAGKAEPMQFMLQQFQLQGRTIWYGKVVCDFDITSKAAWDKRTWWNEVYAWTDGKTVYLRVPEIDSASANVDHRAKSGFEPRFK